MCVEILAKSPLLRDGFRKYEAAHHGLLGVFFDDATTAASISIETTVPFPLVNFPRKLSMPTAKDEKTVRLGLLVKIFVSLLALLALSLHVFMKNDRVDGTAAVLLAIGILPWLADLLDTLELPGGWKFHFRNIEAEQAKQRDQLEQLQLAVRLLLTDNELRHLRELAGTDPLPLHRDWTNKIYETELRRLRALGLIEGSVGDYFRIGDDAHKHLQITEEGIKYLQARTDQERREDA